MPSDYGCGLLGGLFRRSETLNPWLDGVDDLRPNSPRIALRIFWIMEGLHPGTVDGSRGMPVL